MQWYCYLNNLCAKESNNIHHNLIATQIRIICCVNFATVAATPLAFGVSIVLISDLFSSQFALFTMKQKLLMWAQTMGNIYVIPTGLKHIRGGKPTAVLFQRAYTL